MIKKLTIAVLVVYGLVYAAFIILGHFWDEPFMTRFYSALFPSFVITCVLAGEFVPVVLAIACLWGFNIRLSFLILLGVVVFCIWTFLYLVLFVGPLLQWKLQSMA